MAFDKSIRILPMKPPLSRTCCHDSSSLDRACCVLCVFWKPCSILFRRGSQSNQTIDDRLPIHTLLAAKFKYSLTYN